MKEGFFLVCVCNTPSANSQCDYDNVRKEVKAAGSRSIFPTGGVPGAWDSQKGHSWIYVQLRYNYFCWFDPPLL